jgi:uncharacterized protein YlxW (UPF0749 family)
VNPFEMVAIIVVAVMIASVIRGKHSRRRHRDDAEESPQERAENLRLREEVANLKERIKVLERITVEKENSLSRQIEELRDR